MDTSLTLSEYIRNKARIDWLSPDEFGLCNKSLDSRQLCALEVMKWKGEADPIPVFIDAFDCTANQLLLRRNESVRHERWTFITFPPQDNDNLRYLARSIFDREGYGLFYYKAHEVPFSSYYQKLDVTQWALIIELTDEHVTVMDTSGIPQYFEGHIGKIPTDLFFSALQSSGMAGAALLRENEVVSLKHDECWFAKAARVSVNNMSDTGFDHLEKFINELEATPVRQIAASLDQLEYDVHHFLRLRKLWETMVLQEKVPMKYAAEEWSAALIDSCKYWTTSAELLYIWQKQPERDYRKRLAEKLRSAMHAERRMITGLYHVLEGE